MKSRKRRGHFAMEEIQHINDKDLEVEFSKAEEDLQKILGMERNDIDLLNENLKLKKILRNAKVGMWKKYTDLAEANKEGENKNDDLKKQIGKKNLILIKDELVEDNKKLSEGIEKLNEERKEFNENMQDLMDKLFEVESNLEKGNIREDRILEQKAKLVMEVKDKETELGMMKKRLYESEEKMKAVMEDLNSFIERLQREKKNLKEDNEKLRGELQDKNEDIDDLERELKKGGKSVDPRRFDTQLQLDIDIQKQEAGLGKERANQLEKLVENLERELGKMRREESVMREREEDMKDEMKELNRKIKQEERVNENLQNDIEALEDDLKYEIEKRDDQESMKQAGMNVSIIQGRKEMTGLNDKVKKLAQENRKLLDDLERVRAEREVWKDRGAEVEDEVALKTKELEIQKRTQTQNIEELGKIKALLEAKNKELQKRRQNEENLRLEAMRIGDENNKIQGEKMMAEKERDHARKLAEDDRTYLIEDLDKKNDEISHLNNKFKALEMENEDLQFKVYNLEKKVHLAKEIQEKLNSNIEIKEAKITDFKSQIDYLKNQITSTESQEALNKMDLE